MLRILSRRQARLYRVPREAMGAALFPPDGFAYLGNVFAHRVDEMSRETGVEPDVILGRALAHEAGHLLLDRPGHSSCRRAQARRVD